MAYYLTRLISWWLNKRLYGPHTADVIWGIDRRLNNVTRSDSVRMPY